MSLNFRRYSPILLLVLMVLSLLTFILGDQRVTAFTTQSNLGTEWVSEKENDFSNNKELFDNTIVHSIQVLMSDEDYDTMISTYQQTGEKDYFHADVIIDGVRINDVGIRLKGNASLRSAVGGNMNMGGMGQGIFPGVRPDMGQIPQIPEGGEIPNFGERPQPPQDLQPPAADQENPDNDQIPPNFDEQADDQQGNFPAPGNGGFPDMNRLGQNDGEVKIPFMIKFDEFESGQTYQGLTSIAIRTYGAFYDEALLEEPITNQIANLVGIPATQTSYTGFKINDEAESLYVVSELVNQVYLDENFENSNGVLYKAELGSTLNYKGEDPSSYAGSFTQQTRKNDADLLPLISFMRFLEVADDLTFEAELPDWLDVDSFALYLAVNAMVVNTDSMISMNNNFYLYYDDISSQFTVLMWDANESFGKLGGSASYDITLSEVPTDFPGGRMGGRGGMGGGQNVLISRFLGNSTFRSLYEEKLNLVYEQVFQGDFLANIVNEYSDLIHSVNEERSLVDFDVYDQAVDDFLNFIAQRQEYLDTLTLLTE
ncbi:MAG: CotH kinase family protein [Anaerolineaceae bacterium]|nr:CotH kinase family protein [Anaerolineaceae bacterium]